MTSQLPSCVLLALLLATCSCSWGMVIEPDPMVEALEELMLAAQTRPAELAKELRNSPYAAIAPTFAVPADEWGPEDQLDTTALPVVLAHGMWCV